MRRIGLLAMGAAFVVGVQPAGAQHFHRPGAVAQIDSILQNSITSLGVPPRDAAIIADVVVVGAMVAASMGAHGAASAAAAAAAGAAAATGAAASPAPAFSCPVFEGTTTLLGEDSCVWTTVSGQWTSQGSGEAAGTTQGAAFRVGGQRQVAEGWFLGGFLGIGASSGQAGGGYVSTNSQDYDGSIAVKTLRGPWLLAAGLAFGTSLNSLQREAGQIRSTAASYGGSLRLRGAYDLAFEHWYLRPRFDLDLRYFNRPAFQESGISGLAMAFGGDSSIRPALAPALEIGGRFDIADDTILRPYLTIGATFLPDSSTSFQTWFVSGPLATLGTFQTTQSGPNAVANVEAGLQVYRARGFEAKADYALSTGTAWLSQTVALRGAWHF